MMTNKELRRRAWGTFRDRPLRTLGLTAVLGLPVLLCAIWVALVYGAAIWQDLFVLYTDASGMVRMGVTHGLTARMLIPYVTVMFGGIFFVGIVAQGLWTGYVHCLSSLCQGEKSGVRQLFGRLDTCLRVLGLQLLVALKALVWMVPFALLVEAAAFLDPAGKGLLQLAQAAAGIAPAVMAARMVLGHALAVHVMAQEPEITLRAAIRRSKEMMHGNMWRFIRLHVPYVLWCWAVTIVSSAVTAYVPAVQTAATYLATLVYALAWLLSQLAGAGFYGEMKAGPKEGELAGKSEQEPLREEKITGMMPEE